MTKTLLTWAFLLMGASAFAEKVGNINIDLPTSKYEWNEVFDTYKIDQRNPARMAAYAHREGDALELLVAFMIASENEDNTISCESEDNESMEEMMRATNDFISSFCKNHKVEIQTNSLGKEVIEWSFSDKNIDLFSGVSRFFRESQSDYMIAYFTTAQKSDSNFKLWNEALSQATVLSSPL